MIGRLCFVVLLAVTVSAGLFTPAAAAQTTYTDPFAYCVAVNTIDAPDARYTGPALPEALVGPLRTAAGLAPDAPLDSSNTFWRCLGGALYACTTGANLPCQEKANTSTTPTPEVIAYCQSNPNGDIPAVVTGNTTVYEWTCQNGVATVGRQVFQVDSQGFIANIWYPFRLGAAGPQLIPTTGATSTDAVRAVLLLLGAGSVLLGLAFRRTYQR